MFYSELLQINSKLCIYKHEYCYLLIIFIREGRYVFCSTHVSISSDINGVQHGADIIKKGGSKICHITCLMGFV